MALENVLSWISVVFASLAAVFWGWSAAVHLPERVTSGWGGSGGSVQAMGDALRRQARLSQLGAACAAVAAAAQAMLLLL
jgi:hypothetical protein